MSWRAWSVALSALALAGCTCGRTEPALHVRLQVGTAVVGTCLALDLHDSADGRVLDGVRLERRDGVDLYHVGVSRGPLPSSVVLVASALDGVGCDAPLAVSVTAPELLVAFPASGVTVVDLPLFAPPASDDADGDGFASRARGGADCDDTRGSVHPGAPEDCGGALDLDCDALVGCADPSCAAACADGGAGDGGTLDGGGPDGGPVDGGAGDSGVDAGPPAPTDLVFLAGPTSVPAASCSTLLTVGLTNDAGQLFVATAATTVTLTASPSGSVTFFQDSSCATPLGALIIAADAGTARFAVRGTAPGPVTVTASSPPLRPTAWPVTLVDAVPASIALTTPARTQVAGACSSPVTVEVRDALGAPAKVPAVTALALAAAPGTGFALFGDLGCTAPVLALALDAGSTAGSFWFRGTLAGGVTVWVDAGVLGAVSQPETVVAGPASALRFSTPPQALDAGSCSLAALVQTVDPFGNLAPVASPLALDLTSAPAGGFGFFADPTCATLSPLANLDGGASTSQPFYFRARVAGSFTVTASGADAGLGTTSQVETATLGWPAAGYAVRRQLIVSTGPSTPTGDYDGYTLSFTFDTATEAANGRLRTDGDDLRIMRWTGLDWQELDRELVAPNTATSEVRFRSRTTIPASSDFDRYYLFTGRPSATPAPANLDNVYLFQDGFESASLAKWTVQSGLWATATDRVRTGANSLKYTAESSGGGNKVLLASPALSEADVLFEAWWSMSTTANNDFSQFVRQQPGAALNEYETNLEGTAGWNAAKMVAGAWTETQPNAGTPANSGWTRIGLALVGTKLRLFKDGVQIVPASGAFDVGTQFATGNIGFRKWVVPGSNSWWVDDVTVRRLADPEPTVAVGAPVAR